MTDEERARAVAFEEAFLAAMEREELEIWAAFQLGRLSPEELFRRQKCITANCVACRVRLSELLGATELERAFVEKRETALRFGIHSVCN